MDHFDSTGTAGGWAPGGAPPRRINGSTNQRFRAFTLIEMLAVIAIIGIIASLSVPVIKNFGKADVTVSASRQMLDAVGYARQLAMSQRTTVYMVFVPPNFWNNTWYGNLTPAQLTAVTNLFGMQLCGYTYLADGALGDQPGRHTWHYLAPWQSLPDGSFIPPWKFANPNGFTQFADPVNANYGFTIYPFAYTNLFPFPTEDSAVTPTTPFLPYIAFNYLGQLANYSGQLLSPADLSPGQYYDEDFAGGGADIPLAQGSLVAGRDPNTHAPILGSPQVMEMPPGNSTNISYNVIHIDPLTGRATLEYHKMQ
ncbi:MAG: prepilin-type N-terminal cleavage/methylation domain-containing protein [Limisphaerales bacterium]